MLGATLIAATAGIEVYLTSGGALQFDPGTRPVYNRLAVLRPERRLSRRQLADKLGINYETIG